MQTIRCTYNGDLHQQIIENLSGATFIQIKEGDVGDPQAAFVDLKHPDRM